MKARCTLNPVYLHVCGLHCVLQGFFVEPTVVLGVEDSMRIARDEIFGPVMTIMR